MNYITELQEQHAMINSVVNEFYVDDIFIVGIKGATYDNGKFTGIKIHERYSNILMVIHNSEEIYNYVFTDERYVTKEMILEDVDKTIKLEIDCYMADLENYK